jgi:hypothetical protein
MKKKISKKTILHDEVQSRISKMLYNKNILYKNNPVDNTETNARLIKSFLYRQISNKYPKYNSFAKISTINSLDDNELSNLLHNLPDLDEFNNNIQKSKEKRNLEKEKKSNISDEESDSDDVNNTRVDNTRVDNTLDNTTLVDNTIKVDNTTLVDNTIKVDNTCSFEKEEEMTNSDINELNDNFNLTDKIITIVRKIVIVYAFYRFAKWFL